MHFPSLLFGDVNGDSRSDLLVQHGRKELRVFIGVPGPDLFCPEASEGSGGHALRGIHTAGGP